MAVLVDTRISSGRAVPPAEFAVNAVLTAASVTGDAAKVRP